MLSCRLKCLVLFALALVLVVRALIHARWVSQVDRIVPNVAILVQCLGVDESAARRVGAGPTAHAVGVPAVRGRVGAHVRVPQLEPRKVIVVARSPLLPRLAPR